MAGRNEAVLTVSQANLPYRARMKLVLGVEDSVLSREIELAGGRADLPLPHQGEAEQRPLRSRQYVLDEAAPLGGA